MARVVQGYQYPLEQATDRTWDPRSGWKSSRVFEGDETMIQSMANNIVSAAGQFVRVDVKPKPPNLATLTINYDGIADGNKPSADSQGEPVPDADSWSLQGTDSERDIWSHSSITSLASTDPNGWSVLRKKVAEAQKNANWQDIIDAWDSSQFSDSDYVLDIFKMLRDGVEAYSVSQFVLQRDRGISSAAQGTISVSYVGYQFTAAQLISFEGLPATLSFGLPSTGSWIKRTPSIQYDAVTGKMSVSNSYWHAYDWNSILYPSR